MQKKKPSKSDTSVKSKVRNVDDSWRSALDAVSINDENWWCFVIMMVESIPEHSQCVSLFKTSADEGRRRAICSINYQDTLVNLKTLSKQNPDTCPAMQNVCHYASKILNESGGTLPSWLMAQVVKYMVHRAKEMNVGIGRRRAELEREIDREYLIMQTVQNLSTSSRSKKLNEASGKANTKLRKRDEGWRDAVYVDDAPLNGPDLYIILTGFYDPNLPMELINTGVPLIAILQIKGSNEESDSISREETIVEKTFESKKLQFLQSYHVDRSELVQFWRTLEGRMKDLETYSVYCDVVSLSFHADECLMNSEEDEYEKLMKDIYNKVSYIAYDLYDLHRQHRNYLKSMKVVKSIAENKEKCDTQIYETIVNSIPQDYISVPIVLSAMLLQVESSNAESLVDPFLDTKSGTILIEEPSTQDQRPSKTTKPSAISLVKNKLKTLNPKYDLESPTNEESLHQHDLDLVLHGDNFDPIARHFHTHDKCKIPSSIDFQENVLRVLWHPRIMGLWHEHDALPETKIKDYSRHFAEIRRYFDASVSEEEIKHCLHLLILEKMIFNKKLSPRGKTNADTKGMTYRAEIETSGKDNSNLSTSSISSLRSEPKRKSCHAVVKPSWRSKSDGDMNSWKSTVNCSPLFNFIDPREALAPGYLKSIIQKRTPEERILEEFNTVEPLSRQVFFQAVYDSFLKFDRYQSTYYEPTDTVLVHFFNECEGTDVNDEETVSSIRTPVCFREFCKYVVPEESDWIEREEEAYRLQAEQTARRLMKKIPEKYEEAMIFPDKHFILPGSLKARGLEGSNDGIESRNILDSNVSQESKGDGMKRERKKEDVKKGRGKNEEILIRKVSSKGKSEVGVNATLPTGKESLSVREEEEKCEFVGYDLGKLRVQVTNRKKTFFMDGGVLVRVGTDDWLHKNKDLRITVTIGGSSLRLFRQIGFREDAEVFHLTTKGGIILAFSKASKGEEQVNLSECNWRDMNFDFRVSWPSGLLIEPITGDGPKNPFYIRQSYISNALSKNDVYEVCRKFLRNGTVLKYLSDDSVVVLRPNSDIVTCSAFKKLEKYQVEKFDDGTISVKGESTKKDTKPFSRHKRRPSNAFKSQLSGVVEEDFIPTQMESMPMDQKHGSTSSMAVAPTTLKVSRYTLLNHDGRQYDVLDDLVVSEDHRLLVRTASDYEVNEKFTRRADGTDMLLNRNGELIVSFPDGTRITTGFTIEEEAVTCDWTQDEISRYFIFRETQGAVGRGSTSSSNSKFHGGISSRPSTMYDDEMTEILIADSFVSILLTCRIEHKNYATVFYDQSAVNCSLSMPDDLRVSITRRGHYEVSLADEVNLKILQETLTFTGKSCTCGGESTSIYNFFSNEALDTIFTSADVIGNVLEVKNDGTTRYHRKSQPSERWEFNSNETVFDSEANKGGQRTKEAEEDKEDDEKFEDKNRCDPEIYCLGSPRSRYRIFASNRDLTAYEYLHRSVKREAERPAVFDNDTSVILYPIPRRPDLCRLITFEPMELEPRSKAALLLPFQKSNIKPRNYNRKDLLRSTYSIPYNWLFPLGKNGDGIWENTHHIPLIESVERALPELLKIRVRYDFKEPGENGTIQLQRALGRYWISLVDRAIEEEITVEKEEQVMEADFKNLEDDLFDFAYGIKKKIDVSTYRNGLEKKWRKSREKTPCESIGFVQLLKQRDSKRDESEWYKYCMREGIVLPYFQNTAGACFLWIKDCVEDVFKISSSRTGSSMGMYEMNEGG